MQNGGPKQGLCLLTLDSLVTELLKDRPNEKLVKAWMAEAGLDYSTDPVVRLNTVLAALNNVQSVKAKTRRVHERSV